MDGEDNQEVALDNNQINDEPIAGDNVIMSGNTDNPSPEENDGMMATDALNASGNEGENQPADEIVQMDAEQEYAQMDYRICGELSKQRTS